ncbi:MAG TPA: ABC transporter substrate-binding protein [Caulobacterales bacterium]|nr:ABC transporter substrate-binding protein [Caulobacterales bacterium]
MSPFGSLRSLIAGAGLILALVIQPARADELSLVFGGETPPLMNSLNLIANGAGFYEAENLKISKSVVDGTAKAVQLCASGQADICPIGVEAAISGYDDGARLKMFLTRASKFGYVIAVLDDSPIKTLAELKGKKIGVHSLAGTSPIFATHSALKTVGLTPSDYTLVAIGITDAAAEAFRSRKVDAVALPLYELVPYMVAGLKMRIFHHPTLEASANAGYLAAPSVIAAKQDAFRRFSRAIVKASLLVRYNPEAAARARLVAEQKPFAAEDVRKNAAELNAWQDDLPAANPKSKRIGAPSVAGMQSYIELLHEAGVTKAVFPASDIVTDEFIPFANEFDRKKFETAAKAMR